MGPISGSITYMLDNDLFTVSRQVNGRAAVEFEYDQDKFLTLAGELIITHDSQNALVASTVLGTMTNRWLYNEFGEPTNQTAVFGSTEIYTAEYGRDALGRIISKAETIEGARNQYEYHYDLGGRLERVVLNGATISSYSYDSNGNRLSWTLSGQTATATTDEQDRLTTHGAATYTYGRNGELAAKAVAGQITTYEYDVFGNLLHVRLPNGTEIEYLVDGANRRIGKKVNGVIEQGFLYDQENRIIAELDSEGEVVSEFVYGTHEHAPDYFVKGGSPYRIISDHLGSPLLVVNATSGQVVQRLEYDDFGRVLADTAPGFQPFGFAGGLYDVHTGLVRFGARDYDAETGRWTAKDPILFDGGDSNVYAYVGNDPVNKTDPSGLEDYGPGPTPQHPAVQKLNELKKKIEKSPIKPGGQPDFCKEFNKKQAFERGMPPPTGPGGFSPGFSISFSF